MDGRTTDAQTEHIALAVAAGLLALVSPVAAAICLLSAGIFVAASGQFPTVGRADHSSLLGLAAVAVAGGLWGLEGAAAAALIWRGWAEISRSPGTYGLMEPPWLAIAYRWSPLAAAVLFRIEAPSAILAPMAAVAALTMADWAIRRLAEWRLGEPQPYDTRAYMLAQGRVLGLVLMLPDVLAALAALLALAAARQIERRPAHRYATAL